jgi:hypothetical protein
MKPSEAPVMDTRRNLAASDDRLDVDEDPARDE